MKIVHKFMGKKHITCEYPTGLRESNAISSLLYSRSLARRVRLDIVVDDDDVIAGRREEKMLITIFFHVCTLL
jgi:hypothetical protein